MISTRLGIIPEAFNDVHAETLTGRAAHTSGIETAMRWQQDAMNLI